MAGTRIHVRELVPDLPLDLDGNDGEDSKYGHVAIAPGDIALGVAISRASEYFDFFVYAIASALIFPSVFFPHEGRLEGSLYVFVIFALAFIARPFGTIAFMAIQRRYGRGVKLTLAVFLLGLSTVGIAFLPGYAHLGAASILFLAIFRIGQGIALGGAWDGLGALLATNAPQSRQSRITMLGQLGAPVGFIFASGLFAYLLINLSNADFMTWGWRYPFYVAFAINVVALFARLRLITPDEYAALLDTHECRPSHVIEMIPSQAHNLLIGAMVGLSTYALFHLVTVFPLSWISLYSTRPLGEVLLVQMFGGLLAAAGVIASGALVDRIGRRSMLIAVACLIALFSWLIPALLNGSAFGQNSFILVGFILLGLTYGQVSEAANAHFPAKYRYTGAALTCDLSWLLGAGFAPLVALGLSAHFGLVYAGIYLLSGVVCTLGALSFRRNV